MIVMNKADIVDKTELMRVNNALMFTLGKVRNTPGTIYLQNVIRLLNT